MVLSVLTGNTGQKKKCVSADTLQAAFVSEIINWAEGDPLMQQIADTNRVYLVGHSRGGEPRQGLLLHHMAGFAAVHAPSCDSDL